MPRRVRVATVALCGRSAGSLEANREMAMELLDRACAERADIVCLPEGFATAGVKGGPLELAESVPGPTTDAAAGRAREHRTYVVCPLYRREGERVHNSAVVLDRGGAVVGVYDKMHLANTSWRAYREREAPELEGGATPGREAQVFELDFGRVGVQTCFDLGFEAGWRQLAERGAELVLWTAAFGGGFHLRCRAYLHGYYVASSVRTAHAQIISPLGEVLERTGEWRPVVARTIDLDYMVCYFDWHKQKIEEMKAKYGEGVSVRVLQEEGHFLVESAREDLPLAEVVREFDLRSSREFHDWHREAFARLRAEDRKEAP